VTYGCEADAADTALSENGKVRARSPPFPREEGVWEQCAHHAVVGVGGIVTAFSLAAMSNIVLCLGVKSDPPHPEQHDIAVIGVSCGSPSLGLHFAAAL
jgi:hypothetical protein